MSAARAVIGSVITVFWVVMMGLLVRDHVLRKATRGDLLEAAALLTGESWRDYQEWMRLIISGKDSGVSYTVVRRLETSAGYVVGNRTWLDLDVWGERHPFRLEMAALLDNSFRLVRAVADVRVNGTEMEFAALVSPSRLLYRWRMDDRVRVSSQRIGEGLSLLDALRPLLARRLDLKVGDVYRLPVLDSTWSLREGMAEVRVEALERVDVAGESVEAFRLVTRLGPFSSITWISRDGEVLRRAFANVVMERISARQAAKRFPAIAAPIEVRPLGPSDFRGPGVEDPDEQTTVGPLGLLVELLSER